MNQKGISSIVIILIIVGFLFVAGGGFWYYQQQRNQKIEELNKSLPSGIKINLTKNQYQVTNTLDGYKFKIPKELNNLEIISYDKDNFPLQNVLVLGSRNNVDHRMAISSYKIKSDISLESFISDLMSKTKVYEGIKKKTQVGEYQVVEVALKGLNTNDYFLKKGLNTYSIRPGDEFQNDENFIKNIILQGEW